MEPIALTISCVRSGAWTILLLAIALVPLGRPAAAQEAGKPEAPDLTWGVKIPMRDGVELNATVYRPHGQAAPLPVVFTMTPYISDTYHERGMYFSQHGYVFVMVDVRGRGNSGGSFEPFANDPRDGHDVVEWLASQPWCDGMVAMWGGSYAGFNQWATLKEAPPHLATIVPAAAAHASVDFPFHQNIFSTYDMQWLTYTSGRTGNLNLFGESSFWGGRFTELYMGHLPYSKLDSLVGNRTTAFQKWLQHPTPDAYWDGMAPTPERYRELNLPILTITGHYDGDQLGAMEYYRRHMLYGTPEGKAKHYLILGPWDHAGTRTPRQNIGGLDFGEASLLDLNELHRQWYDWTMKGGEKPTFLKDRVAYYVLGPGADEWKYAPTLEAISPDTLSLFLASPGEEAGSAVHSGSLVPAVPRGDSPDPYTYDPLDTRPGEIEQTPQPEYILDQTAVFSLQGDGLVYHTAPFPEATELTGFPELDLWIEMDVPDTDFQVALYEVLRDGTSILLSGDQIRARYRESLREATLVRPGTVNEYRFRSFTFFSRMVSAGSRLRLLVTSPNSIRLEKNYNSGGVVAEESGADARTAHIRVYHDPDHPSQLRIPVPRR